MASSETNPIKLRRADWDFSTVPEDEVEACLRFELLREIKDQRSYFTSLGVEVISEPPLGEGWRMEQVTTIANLICYYHLHTHTFWIAGGSFEAVPWIYLPDDWRRDITEWFIDSGAGLQEIDINKFDPVVFKKNQSVQKIEQVIAFTIDWSHSTTGLVEDFRRWLELSRPEDLSPTIERGRKSTKDGLNALSALRLTHQLHWSSARILTQCFGLPLYGPRKLMWARAAQRARELFHANWPSAPGPVSNDSVDHRPAAYDFVEVEDFDGSTRKLALTPHLSSLH